MIEDQARCQQADVGASAHDDDLSSADAAYYVHQLAGELAAMSRRVGNREIAVALEIAQKLAEDILPLRSTQAENAAPGQTA